MFILHVNFIADTEATNYIMYFILVQYVGEKPTTALTIDMICRAQIGVSTHIFDFAVEATRVSPSLALFSASIVLNLWLLSYIRACVYTIDKYTINAHFVVAIKIAVRKQHSLHILHYAV